MSAAAISGVLRQYERTDPAEWRCLHFSMEAARAAGAIDLTDLIPAYESPRGAIRALRLTGYPTLIDLMDAHATPIKPAHARTGDVCYLDQAPIGAMGIVIGGEGYFLGPEGFRRKPVSSLFVWRLARCPRQ